MKIYILYKIIFLFFILNTDRFQYCSAFFSSNVLPLRAPKKSPVDTPPQCVLSNPPVDLSPPDLLQIIRFLKSQRTGPDEIKDIALTEISVIKQAFNDDTTNNEDINLSASDLVKKYHGVPLEEHTVTTEDGYILTFFRIPGKGSVVFLMSGFLNSSDDWITAGPENALPYKLAAEGYDVWLGNSRGNKYCKKHVCKLPKCANFWDFSWDEMGRYDLTAMIDYILNKTGKNELSYVGYSQGCTSFFVMCSERPEYNEKISVMAALAPAVFMSHARNPILRLLSLNNGIAYKLCSALGINELLPSNELSKILSKAVFGNNPVSKILGANVQTLFSGFDRGQISVKNLPVIFSHSPGGSSSKTAIHFAQSIESAKFRKFNYGKSKNLKVYDSRDPPDYPICKVTAPVAMFYGDNDWFVNATDVAILESRLPNVVDSRLVKKYCHVDFLWASNAKELIVQPVIDLIKAFATDYVHLFYFSYNINLLPHPQLP